MHTANEGRKFNVNCPEIWYTRLVRGDFLTHGKRLLLSGFMHFGSLFLFSFFSFFSLFTSISYPRLIGEKKSNVNRPAIRSTRHTGDGFFTHDKRLVLFSCRHFGWPPSFVRPLIGRRAHWKLAPAVGLPPSLVCWQEGTLRALPIKAIAFGRPLSFVGRRTEQRWFSIAEIVQKSTDYQYGIWSPKTSHFAKPRIFEIWSLIFFDMKNKTC